MSLTQIIRAAMVLVAVACLIPLPSAVAGHGKWFDQTGATCCPVCDHVCKLEAEAIEVEKPCFEVETKAVCIPRVVFPWQTARKAACASCDSCSGRGCTACVHNGARVRKVCVLKPKTYTCPACEYTWTAEKRPCGGCGRSGCGCSHGACCDAAVIADPSLIESAEPATAPSVPQPPQAVSQDDYFRPAEIGSPRAASIVVPTPWGPTKK